MVSSPPAWSSLLQEIIKSKSERSRLAAALGITGMTLSRWANGETKPQKPHLIHLLQAINPILRQEFVEALTEIYPDATSWLTEGSAEQISPEFFASILNMCATTTESLRFWRVSETVLKQALQQLDPNHLGMAVKIVQCMKPGADNKVHSLRERTGKGTSPWAADLEHDVLFLGVESLSGYAVEERHIVSDNDLEKHKTSPAIKDNNEASAAAHPIRFEGKIAGCLLASSAQPGYFSPQRQKLLTEFSDLIALAFSKEDFYATQDIQLSVMPQPSIQRHILANFRQRVTQKFQQTKYEQTQYSNAEVEALVWQDLEAELLEYQKQHAETTQE